MKKFSKILSVALLVALVLSLGVANAFAQSITVTKTVAGETYSAYKMFDLSVNEDQTAYTYTVNSGWTAFFAPADTETGTEAGPGYQYVTISGGYVTAISDVAALAQAAAAWTGKPAAVATKEATEPAEGSEGSVVFDNLDNGYYLITSTLGVNAMTLTTPDTPNATINEKNPEDTIEKKVQEDSDSTWGEENDAQVGDTVNFQSTAKVYPYTRNVFIHDTMDSGLTYNNDVAITGLTAGTDYTVLETPQAGDTFTIQLSDTYIATLTGETTLTLTYTAVLNQNAIVKDDDGVTIVDQNNKTKITYGNKQSVEDHTKTTSHKFEVIKFKTGDNTKTVLAGAVFQVKKDGTVLNLVKLDERNYRIATAAEVTAAGTVKSHLDANGNVQEVAVNSVVSDFITVSTGSIFVWGVDSDTYKLNETKAPDGFNKLADEVDVAVNSTAATSVDVPNGTGAELPSTGGIGTTIFYVVGGVLVLAAIILLVTKKRMSE